VRSALQKAPNGAIGADQIDKLRSAVTAALQNPRDIDVLRALAEMARDLSAVVDGYSQQRHTLDEIAASIGSPSP
jgi:hypothetical protein